MKLFKKLLLAWSLIAAVPLSLSHVEKAHAQFTPPFNASSVATLGGSCTQQGSLMFQSANSLSKCLGSGVNGQVLESAGPGADLKWLTVTGTGTVTSVALSSPATFFTVSGSPITNAGTLTQTLVSAAQNTVWAGPTSGTGTPAYRALVLGDIPTGYPTANLSGTVTLPSQVSGTLTVALGGTGVTAFSGGGSAHLIGMNTAGNGFMTIANGASAGQLLVNQSSTAAPAFVSASGDVSAISAAGAITVASIGGHAPGVAASGLVQFNASTQYPAADGSLITKVPGTEINTQIFSASGTYTRTTNATHGDIYVIAGGGAGGGAPATTSAQHSIGDGGGAGSECIQLNVALPSSGSVVVGAGGTGVAGAAGNNGGASSFNSCTTNGGIGGQAVGPFGSTSYSTNFNTLGGAAGTGGTFNIKGEPGSSSLMINTNYMGGTGGSGYYGGGGAGAGGNVTGLGAAGEICGAGGGGSANGVSQADAAGGAGGRGCVIIVERQ